MKPRDRYERLNDRVRWAAAMCNVLGADPDVQEIHSTALDGIAAHLKDAQKDLEELYQHLSEEPKAANVTALRSKKGAPDETEPEHAA